MREIAGPDGPFVTSDVEAARRVLADDFFGEVFGVHEEDQARLHQEAGAILRAEVLACRDEARA